VAPAGLLVDVLMRFHMFDMRRFTTTLLVKPGPFTTLNKKGDVYVATFTSTVLGSFTCSLGIHVSDMRSCNCITILSVRVRVRVRA